MINFFRIVVLLCTISGYSQINDLYVIVDKSSRIDTLLIENDSIQNNSYILGLEFSQLDYDFEKDTEGKLVKFVSGKRTPRVAFRFVYQNTSDDNPEFLISSLDEINRIHYTEMRRAVDKGKLMKLIKSYPNVYLINEDDKYDSKYRVKKVQFKGID